MHLQHFGCPKLTDGNIVRNTHHFIEGRAQQTVVIMRDGRSENKIRKGSSTGKRQIIRVYEADDNSDIICV